MNNDPNKEWVMEAQEGEQLEDGSDPFLAKSRAKKEAIQVLLLPRQPYQPLLLPRFFAHAALLCASNTTSLSAITYR